MAQGEQTEHSLVELLERLMWRPALAVAAAVVVVSSIIGSSCRRADDTANSVRGQQRTAIPLQLARWRVGTSNLRRRADDEENFGADRCGRGWLGGIVVRDRALGRGTATAGAGGSTPRRGWSGVAS